MDPVTLGLAAKAAMPIVSGISGFMQAKGQKEQASVNSYIGRTRALQTDTTARQGLESELGSMRNVMAANSQTAGVGTLEMVKELRETRDRERRINVGARMSEAADWKMTGKNAGAKGMGSLFGGAIKAGPSLFDLYQYNKGSD